MPESDETLLAIDEALTKFAALDPLKAKLVELRFFGGLTSEQAAGMLDLSPSAADRHWAYARAWLRRELSVGAEGNSKQFRFFGASHAVSAHVMVEEQTTTQTNRDSP